MNTEEKARAYDKALEQAKKELAVSSQDSDSARQIFRLFPELKENNDERIRKGLIDALTVSKSVGELKFRLPEPTRKEAIAWLEKQKEQKPEDDKAFEEWINDWWKHNKVNNPNSYDKGDEIQFDERGFKNFCRGIRNMYQQKPTEWSEGKISKDIEKDAVQFCFDKGINVTPYQAKEIASHYLRIGHNEIYQAAKHDLAIKFMKYLDENRPNGKMCLSNGECEDIDKAFKENDWAKIERYIHKYHWKPSEEQMNALNALNCHGDLSYVGQQNQLISLYNDLKKLM